MAGKRRIFHCTFCDRYTAHRGTRCDSCDTDEADFRPVVEAAGWEPVIRKYSGTCPDAHSSKLGIQAQSWNTCAIGELLGFPCVDGKEIYEAVSAASPALHDLGRQFTANIYREDYPGALKVHREIHSGKFDAAAKDVRRKIDDSCHEVLYTCSGCLSGWYEYETRIPGDGKHRAGTDQSCRTCESGTARIVSIDGKEVPA